MSVLTVVKLVNWYPQSVTVHANVSFPDAETITGTDGFMEALVPQEDPILTIFDGGQTATQFFLTEVSNV